MTSASPSPLILPTLTDEPASSSHDDPRILNPFDPLMSVTSITGGIPAMTASTVEAARASRGPSMSRRAKRLPYRDRHNRFETDQVRIGTTALAPAPRRIPQAYNGIVRRKRDTPSARRSFGGELLRTCNAATTPPNSSIRCRDCVVVSKSGLPYENDGSGNHLPICLSLEAHGRP